MVDTVSFPLAWKRRWGFGAALFLRYLLDCEKQAGRSPFLAPAESFRVDWGVSHGVIALARERLRADRVIEAQKVGIRYEYRINHDNLAEIEAATREQE